MNTNRKTWNRPSTYLWAAAAFVALVAWPAGAHWARASMRWPLHGLLAFFLGLLVFFGLVLLARVVGGIWRQGAGWIVSRHALSTWVGGVVGLISIFALFYAVEFWRGRHAWAGVIAEASRRGVSLDLASLVPPSVPADTDFAQIPLLAPLAGTVPIQRDAFGNRVEPDLGPLTNVLHLAGRLNQHGAGIKWAQWLEAEPTDLQAWYEALGPTPRPRNAPRPADRREAATAILQALEPLEPMFTELRAHSTRPHCRLPFDFAFPYFSEFHSERVMLGFLRLLRLRATAELALDHPDAAFQDVGLAIRLSQYLSQNPTLFHQSTRAYAVADGLQPLWEGLAARRWTSAQLEELQRQLRTFNPLASSVAQARFVTLANAGFIESIIPTTAFTNDAAVRLTPDARIMLRWVRRVYPVGWSLQDQAAVCRFGFAQEEALAQLMSRPLVQAQEPRRAGELLLASSDPFFPIYQVPRVVEMLWELQQYLPFAETVVRLGELACAVERHRLKHGDYPAALDNLAPAFLAEAPRDPMSGLALRYRRLAAQRFVLYSIGSNGADDGGQPCPRFRSGDGVPRTELDLRHADWVWSMQAQRE